MCTTYNKAYIKMLSWTQISQHHLQACTLAIFQLPLKYSCTCKFMTQRFSVLATEILVHSVVRMCDLQLLMHLSLFMYYHIVLCIRMLTATNQVNRSWRN